MHSNNSSCLENASQDVNFIMCDLPSSWFWVIAQDLKSWKRPADCLTWAIGNLCSPKQPRMGDKRDEYLNFLSRKEDT